MLKNRTFSLRWKMLFLMLLSCIITFATVFVTVILANGLIETEPFSKVIAWGVNKIGSTPIVIVIATSVFLISYILLTRPIILSLKQVENALKNMEEGNFEPNLDIQTHDEVALIARYVNETSTELNTYLDEINKGLDQIAQGHLDQTIAIKENHKLGEMADSINKMAAQLKKSIQEERLAEQSKNDLITGVSHDLRTPLTSILGFLEVIIQDRYKDEVELRYYIDIAHSKAEHLKQLIDDLFEYTRVNNGLPLKCEPLALDDFIEQLMEEHIPVMKQADITGRLKLEQHNVQIFADGEILVRAFINIINNAIQYGKDGKYIDIELQVENEHAHVTIANYGKPIPANDLPFIFDRFYRSDKSRSLDTGGSGLGLAIAKSIIEVHQGTIHAESDAQRTAFKISLPLYK